MARGTCYEAITTEHEIINGCTTKWLVGLDLKLSQPNIG